MRYIERSLIPLAVLLVAATGYVGAVVHAGAEAWDPDVAAQPMASASSASLPQPTDHTVTAEPTQTVVVEALRPQAERPLAERTRELRARRAQTPHRIERAATDGTPSPFVRPDVGPRSISVPTFIVRIGGLRTEEQAADAAARLTKRGYRTSIAPRTSADVARYVVVSELLRWEIAVHRARMQATTGATSTVRDRDSDRSQIVYGHYASLEEADAAAQRIRRQGTTALVVVEGGTTFVISVGPHARPRIDEVVASLSGARYEIEVEAAP